MHEVDVFQSYSQKKRGFQTKKTVEDTCVIRLTQTACDTLWNTFGFFIADLVFHHLS